MIKKPFVIAATLVVLGGVGAGFVFAMQPGDKIEQRRTAATDSQSEETALAADQSEPAQTQEQAQAQVPEQENGPVIVSAVQQVPVEGSGNTDCKLTYSDGTTHQWQWKTPTHENDRCDESLIGKTKSETSDTGWTENDTSWQLGDFRAN